ncbi:IS5/IS1182 family transposase, partial [Streptomyces sp. NPDC059680]
MVIPLNTTIGRGASLVPYLAMLDVSYELVEHVSWLIYTHRRDINSRWRKLGC